MTEMIDTYTTDREEMEREMEENVLSPDIELNMLVRALLTEMREMNGRMDRMETQLREHGRVNRGEVRPPYNVTVRTEESRADGILSGRDVIAAIRSIGVDGCTPGRDSFIVGPITEHPGIFTNPTIVGIGQPQSYSWHTGNIASTAVTFAEGFDVSSELSDFERANAAIKASIFSP